MSTLVTSLANWRWNPTHLKWFGFWLVVFILNVGPQWQNYSSIREVAEVAGTFTALQWIIALLTIKVLIPQLLEKRKALLFYSAILLIALIAAEVYIVISYMYLEPAYAETYGAYYRRHLTDYSLLERLGFSKLAKYIVLSKIPLMLYPTAIKMAAGFYKSKQILMETQQLKQRAELTALKNQLNPHFIFNTLNSIYALALQGSDQTADAVARLSQIFDYVLYRCNDVEVSVNNEVEIISAYIALESIRYSERVAITFNHQDSYSSKVSPLLYLTLLENAFKHGVSDEIDTATIDIDLYEKDQSIIFKICNSKPNTNKHQRNSPPIGLNNLQHQLALIYPDNHQLNIIESDAEFCVTLTIASTHQ